MLTREMSIRPVQQCADVGRTATYPGRGCEISAERQRTSSGTSGRRGKSAGGKRQTAAATSREREREAAETGEQDAAIQQDLAELRLLRRSLVQLARDIIITVGVDPEDGAAQAPGFGPGAGGMGRPRMAGRRMRGRRPYWDGPGPMRRMPPPGPRGNRGIDGPMGPWRRGADTADEDESDER
jgi:hypothetical protein